MLSVNEIGINAKSACKEIATMTTTKKNNMLCKIADALKDNCDIILKYNDIDIKNAKANGTSEAMIDRLRLTKERVFSIADAVRKLVTLGDPVGIIDGGNVLENGLRVEKWRVPLGVVGIIFEARPNVTVDAATLCLKSGNACILRGGKEAINSNKILVKVMKDAIKELNIDSNIVSLIEDTTRESANQMMKLDKYIDVLIPRGGAGLINATVQNSTVPVIKTGTGNCHVYIDKSADEQSAINIINNAKTSRPSVCNAAETLLVHKYIAKDILPKIKKKLDEHNVEIRGCGQTQKILKNIKCATNEDYETEFLDYILAVKVVDSTNDAINHIEKYSSGHSECIVSNSYEDISKFTRYIDAAAVYVNASTRFTDGGEFGLGAEIGISTQKLHARGPMGLCELTTIKYTVFGNGQIR